jgi:hypothetical protein
MSVTVNHFARLSAINVSEHIEKKGGFSYLSWPFAVAQLRLADPAASWEVKRFGDLPYLPTELGVFVEVAVTVQGVTLSQIHPVLDGRNRPIVAPTAFDINTSIQRCLVKAIALHGLGLYIYAGEDLPTVHSEPAANDAGPGPEARQPVPSGRECINLVQQKTIRRLVVEVGVEMRQLLEYFGVRDLAEIPVSDYLRVVRSLEQKRRTA